MRTCVKRCFCLLYKVRVPTAANTHHCRFLTAGGRLPTYVCMYGRQAAESQYTVAILRDSARRTLARRGGFTARTAYPTYINLYINMLPVLHDVCCPYLLHSNRSLVCSSPAYNIFSFRTRRPPEWLMVPQTPSAVAVLRKAYFYMGSTLKSCPLHVLV